MYLHTTAANLAQEKTSLPNSVPKASVKKPLVLVKIVTEETEVNDNPLYRSSVMHTVSK